MSLATSEKESIGESEALSATSQAGAWHDADRPSPPDHVNCRRCRAARLGPVTGQRCPCQRSECTACGAWCVGSLPPTSTTFPGTAAATSVRESRAHCRSMPGGPLLGVVHCRPMGRTAAMQNALPPLQNALLMSAPPCSTFQRTAIYGWRTAAPRNALPRQVCRC